MYFKAKNDGRTGLFRHFPENLFPAARSALKIVLVGVAVSAAAPVMASDVVMDSQDDEALGVQAAAPTDADFRAIFTSWKKMDNVAHATVSIPSRKPVDHISLTSNYGLHFDPFNVHRRAQQVIDIPGPAAHPRQPPAQVHAP